MHECAACIFCIFWCLVALSRQQHAPVQKHRHKEQALDIKVDIIMSHKTHSCGASDAAETKKRMKSIPNRKKEEWLVTASTNVNDVSTSVGAKACNGERNHFAEPGT